MSTMAADERPSRLKNRKPVLMNKLEGCSGKVNSVVIIPKEDGVISVSEDRTVRVWLKRDSGMYWPSICHSLSSPATSMEFSSETRRIFIGQDSGIISEFSLSEDYNRLLFRRDYSAHSSLVTGIIFSLVAEFVLSVGRDKYFQWHCSESGRRLGGFRLDAWGTAVQFDEDTKHAFIADYSGQITVLKVTDNDHQVITTLRGHSGSIRCLSWDREKKLLFSGSFDQSIIAWDIGGGKGTAYELQGHLGKVDAVSYCGRSKHLFSGGDDGQIVVWDMDDRRKETPDWQESDVCQKCGDPFFWNFKEMWEKKTIGVRQHHCRKCGKALCDDCCLNRTRLPALGFEFEVRICDECLEEVTDEDRVPMATFHEAKHNIISMHIDHVKGQMVTCGTDKVIKLWDISSIIF
ncbi:WD repeat and FYVE domain-containing protein 2-like isoform X1 [Lytechinus pictus]|uniref:WD repeat and FYVE domain-containing protein 2-like isoform X1 n=1 Tax=Lytechinus pictus TaxID=7653 RepID=UPI0030B9F549